MQYSDAYHENVFSFVNNINTIEGGTHLVGFRTALTRTLNNWAQALTKFLKEKDPVPSGDDFKEGLAAIVSAKVPDPQFESQTKIKLGNREVQSVVESDRRRRPAQRSSRRTRRSRRRSTARRSMR